MKQCRKCLVLKDFEYFHKDKTSKDGFYRWCKECKQKYDREYRQLEKVKSYNKSDKRYDKRNKFFNENYESQKLKQIKSRAKQRGLEFNLEIGDVEFVTHCPLLGVEIDYKKGRGRRNINGASFDRIDNSLGYVKGNVWVLSKLANLMKSRASIDELITFSENVLNKFKD